MRAKLLWMSGVLALGLIACAHPDRGFNLSEFDEAVRLKKELQRDNNLHVLQGTSFGEYYLDLQQELLERQIDGEISKGITVIQYYRTEKSTKPQITGGFRLKKLREKYGMHYSEVRDMNEKYGMTANRMIEWAEAGKPPLDKRSLTEVGKGGTP